MVILILQFQNPITLNSILVEKQTTNTIKSLHDRYSDMLYGMALEISPSSKEAEIILINTFQKVQNQNINHQENSSVCATLIKLLTQTAHEVLKPDELKHKIKLKHFENAPLLDQLLCEQLCVHDICLKNELTPLEVSKKVREEVNNIRKLVNEKNLPMSKGLNIAF